MNPCTWLYDEYDGDSWSTTCGRMFCMTDGTPKDNDYHYCPGCGGPLVEDLGLQASDATDG